MPLLYAVVQMLDKFATPLESGQALRLLQPGPKCQATFTFHLRTQALGGPHSPRKKSPYLVGETAWRYLKIPERNKKKA